MFMPRIFLVLILSLGALGTAAYAGPAQQCALDVRMKGSGAAARTPTILDAWKLKYPTSTIPTRMATLAGLECYTCHDPAGFSLEGNCYRRDLRALILAGSTVADALDALDGVDSDGDGYANGVEATMPRIDSPDIGYNMGLVGDTGTNPCGTTPTVPISGVPETPPEPIPAVSQWGLLVMSLFVMGAGVAILIRRSHRTA